MGRVLGAAGIDIDRDIDRRRQSAADSATALAERRIDAFFFTGGLPTPAIDRLAVTHRIRLLSLGDLVSALRLRYGDVYLARSIPANTYRGGYEVTSKRSLIAAHTEARRLDHRTALVTFPVPLHPGSVRYYRESKELAAASGSAPDVRDL